jgi:predicted small lipoprotein YifL
MSTLKKLVALGVVSLGLLGCEREGPLERFGEEVDEAAENVRNGGETTENRVDDAIDDVRDGVEDARDELDRDR